MASGNWLQDDLPSKNIYARIKQLKQDTLRARASDGDKTLMAEAMRNAGHKRRRKSKFDPILDDGRPRSSVSSR